MRLLIALALVGCGKDPAPSESSRPAKPVAAVIVDAAPMVDAPVDASVPVDAAEVRENGVLVRPVAEPAGCDSRPGSVFDGMCARTVAACQGTGYLKQCTPTDAFACFDRAMRTSGKVKELCARSYGECVRRAEEMKADAETASVTECVIYRYGKAG